MTPPHDDDERENAPTDEQDTDQDRELHGPTVDLDDEEMEELTRLRAAMGFIPEPDAEPKIIDGRYEVLRTLGRGGMGVVLLVRDLEMDTQVALKLIRDSYLRDAPSAPAKLREEARCMAQLRGHPNVVVVLEVGTDGDSAYFTMQYVDGPDLRAWLEEESRTREDILRTYLGAARGLLAAHEHGIAHRDFKPENVLVDASGAAKVTDFGIATLADAPAVDMGDTHPGGQETVPRGTVAYMPPEQMLGERPNSRTDQFSFCVALWEALTGQLPYVWRSPKSQREALEGSPSHMDLVPRRLRPVLLEGMSFERRDRHASMQELIEAIEWELARPALLRRVGIGTTGTILAIGLGLAIGALWLGDHVEPTCEAFVASIENHWGPPQHARLIEHGEKLGADVSWAGARLDSLTETWAAEARSLCNAARAPEPADPKRACLERWVGPLDRAVELLTENGDRDTLLRAPDLIASLVPPNDDFCAFSGRPGDPKLAELVEGARAAAIVGARERADELSQAALVRAEALPSDVRYTDALAHAHAARGEVLMFAREFEAATDSFELAEAHAMGNRDFETLARVRVLWAKSLGFLADEGTALSASEHLARTLPLFVAGNMPDDALIRGEHTDAQAIVHEALGEFEFATDDYDAAAAFFEGVDNPLLAARAIHNRGTLLRDTGDLEAAEADFRKAVEMFESEGVPPDYPRLVGAQFSLALVMYDLYFEIEDEHESRKLADRSLELLDRVIEHAEPRLRLQALGLACQVAADTEQLQRVAPLVERADVELATVNVEQGVRDHVAVQVALSMLLIDAPDANARARALLDRGDELDPALYWALARDVVEHFERTGACKQARMTLERIEGLDHLDEFNEWKSQRPAETCARQPNQTPEQETP